MSTYREYRGLFRETIRVPENSFAARPRLHNREPFPFSAIAASRGRDRDKFAALALRVRWIDDLKGPRN